MTFQEDDAVLAKLFIMEAGLSDNKRIIRIAGIVDTLNSFAQPIIQGMQESIKKNGLLQTLSSYIIHGALTTGFGLGWWGPMISIALSAFGLDPGELVKMLYNYITNGVKSGSINANSDPSELANELAATKLKTAASLDLLHQLNKQGKLHTLVQNKNITVQADFNKSANWFTSLLGMFSKSGLKPSKVQATTFLGGILKFLFRIVMMVVVGLLMKEGVTAFSQYLTAGSTKPETSTSSKSNESSPYTWFGLSQPATTTQAQQAPQSISGLPPIIPHTLSASGQGEQYHINDKYTHWVVGLIDGSVKKTLIYWTVTIYPILKKYEAYIDKSPAFGKVLSLLSRNYDPEYPKGLIILQDSGLHSWREIVDHFVGEIVARIKKGPLVSTQPATNTQNNAIQPVTQNKDLSQLSKTDVMDKTEDKQVTD